MTAAAHLADGPARTARPARRRDLRQLLAALVAVTLVATGWSGADTAGAGSAHPGALESDSGGWAATSGDSVARIDGEPAHDDHALHTYAALEADEGYHTRVDELLDAYTINLVDSPGIELYRTDLEAAAAALRQHSGVEFTVAASTVPARTSHTAHIDVVVTLDGSPCGAWTGGLIGCGGWEGTYDADGDLTIRRGNVWIAPYSKDLTASQRRGLILHEIGHAVGLNHYDQVYEGSRQLMYPQLLSISSYQRGDTNGLAALGGRAATTTTTTTTAPPSTTTTTTPPGTTPTTTPPRTPTPTAPTPTPTPTAPTPTAAAPTPTGSLVHALYADLLGRDADPSGHGHWVARIDAGTPVSSVANAFVRSDEWLGRVVDGLYDEALGRAADPGGRAHWIRQLRNGTSTPTVAAAIWGSPERVRAAGGTEGWVQEMYTSLLGRPADDDGHRWWVQRATATGHSAVARSFYQSLEKRLDRVDALYRALLDRPADGSGARWWADRILRESDVTLAANLIQSREYQERATRRFS